MSKANYAQMSAGIIDESLTELGIAFEGVKTVPAKVQLLTRYFKSKSATMADCTVCGGASDENYRRCPFCGDAVLIDGSAPAAEVSAVAQQMVEQAAPEKPKREKKAKPVLALVPPLAPAVIVPPGDPAHAPAVPDAKYTVKDLDRVVARAGKKMGEMAKGVWAIGNEVLEIYGKSLWRLRKNDDGAPKYSSFNLFCSAELGMSHTQAYKFMGVSKAFDATTIEELGPSKLSLIVHQPKEEQERLLAEIKGGASARDIVDSRNQPSRANNAGTRTPPVATQSEVDRARDVSIMVRAPKSVEIDMLGANTKGKPAMTLADDPWGEEEHENGVITRYAIRTNPDTGTISLVITRRRAPTK